MVRRLFVIGLSMFGLNTVIAQDKPAEKAASGETSDMYKDYQGVLKKLRKDMKNFKPNLSRLRNETFNLPRWLRWVS